MLNVVNRFLRILHQFLLVSADNAASPLGRYELNSEARPDDARPISVTVLAWLFIAVGVIAFVRNFPSILHLEKDSFLIEFVELVGLTAGIFMLRRQNWARWLAIVWMAFHVAVAAFFRVQGLLVHILIFAGITVLLLRSDSAAYFRRTRSDTR
jgi:hypothetical protein